MSEWNQETRTSQPESVATTAQKVESMESAIRLTNVKKTFDGKELVC